MRAIRPANFRICALAHFTTAGIWRTYMQGPGTFLRLRQTGDGNLTSLLRARDAIAAIEFAFMTPVFLAVFVGMVDLGMMLFQDYQLDQAVAAGEQYAVVNASSVNSTSGATLANNIASAVENANGSGWAGDVVVVNNGPSDAISNGQSTTGGTASNADSCYCPTGSPPTWTWGS